MDKEIYYESTSISYKTMNNFEKMYEAEKRRILSDLKKILKEKYNIDINGSKEFVAPLKTTSNNPSSNI